MVAECAAVTALSCATSSPTRGAVISCVVAAREISGVPSWPMVIYVMAFAAVMTCEQKCRASDEAVPTRQGPMRD